MSLKYHYTTRTKYRTSISSWPISGLTTLLINRTNTASNYEKMNPPGDAETPEIVEEKYA